MDDWQLLEEFVKNRSQAAFALLVERHIHFVYSTCLREVRDTSLAEDVTQVVFLLLAKKAPALRRGTVLSGWLFNAARFAARDALKSEVRRQQRECKVAQQMCELTNEDAAWRDIEPLLHDALATLGEEERNVVLLRFFEGKSLRETGAALGISEDAARMRVTRAVSKLKKFFLSRGFTVSGTALAALLGENAIQAAPASCASAVLQTAQCITAGGSTATIVSAKVLSTLDGTVRAMLLAKAKTAAVACLSVSLVGAAGGQVVRQCLASTSSTPDGLSMTSPRALAVRDTNPETLQRNSLPKPTVEALDDAIDSPKPRAVSLHKRDPHSVAVGARVAEAQTYARPTAGAMLASLTPRFLDAPGRVTLLESPSGTTLDSSFRRNERIEWMPVSVGSKSAAPDSVPEVPVAATIKGRVVDEQGHPLAGVTVWAQSLTRSSAQKRINTQLKTDGEGHFEMGSLFEGRFLVRLSDSSGQHVGQERYLHLARAQHKGWGDITLQSGALVEGVTMGENGTPLPGVVVIAQGKSSFEAGTQTGADSVADSSAALSGEGGRYTMRVPLGKVRFYVPGAPKGWLSPVETGPDIDPSRALILNIDPGSTTRRDWILPRAWSLRLQVLDDAGKPIPNIELKILQQEPKMSRWHFAKTDAQGRAALETLSNGPLTIKAPPAWSLVGTATASATKGLQAPEQKLRLRRLAVAAQGTLQGRVVSPDGKPVAGAQVSAYIHPLHPHLDAHGNQIEVNDFEPRSARTDTRGAFSIAHVDAGSEAQVSAQKRGFSFRAGMVRVPVPSAGPQRVPDLVLLPLAARARGRIIDAQGQPVMGAQVLAPASIRKTPTLSRADGTFTLGGLPEGKVRVLAIAPLGANGKRPQVWGEALVQATNTASNTAPVSLVLRAMAPLPGQGEAELWQAREMLEALKASGQDFTGRSWIAFPLAARDLDAALELTGAEGLGKGSLRGLLLARFAAAHPEEAAMRAESEMAKITDNAALMRAIEAVVPRLKTSDPDVARSLWRRWQIAAAQREKVAPLDLFELVEASKLAGEVDDASLPKYLAQLQAQAGPNDPYAAAVWARFRPEQAKALLAPMKGGALTSALQWGITEMAPSNPHVALPLLARLHSLSGGEREEDFRDPQSAYREAALAVVRALADTATDDKRAANAKLALEIASGSGKELRGEIVLQTARLLERTEAVQYLSEALDEVDRQNQFDIAPQLALAIYDRDEAAGRKAFENQMRKLENVPAGAVAANAASWCMALAAVDRPRARLLIERDWGLLSDEKMMGDERAYAIAMAACDFERAQVMCSELSDKQTNRAEGRLALARWLLADDKTRRGAAMKKWQRLDGTDEDD